MSFSNGYAARRRISRQTLQQIADRYAVLWDLLHPSIHSGLGDLARFLGGWSRCRLRVVIAKGAAEMKRHIEGP